jgi:serine/threonine-protein kinase PknG
MNCQRPGCTGTIEDGYCNLCGLAPTAAPAPTASRGTTSSGTASGGRANGGTASGGTASGGTSSTRTGGTRGSSRTRGRGSLGTRGSLGAGLVEVAPVPYRDPTSVVLAHPEVPEAKRFCGNCGGAVGRARGERPGRTEGFCPSCGRPFSFSPKLVPGDMVAGQYQVAGCLAHGGLGWIYLAQDRHVSDRWVVLKGLLDSGDRSAMAAAIAERQFLARVEHPNIVRIYNFVTHDDAGYIVMEYVGGQSLRDLRRSGPLPVAQACAYLLEMLPALGYLHRQGLLFCDFKPDNVIQSEEQLRLIDLGGVRSADDDTSDLYGTVGYQAPEVPTTGATIASDLYTAGRALAVLTFDFRGFTDPARYATSLPPAAEVPVSRYEAFWRFLLKATHPDPEARFADAGEMADQLIGVLRQVVAIDGGHPPSATSGVFTAEVAPDPYHPSWQALPAPLIDPTDPAAALVGGLGAAAPEQVLGALAPAPRTPETRYRAVRALIEVDLDQAAAELAIGAEELDWRTGWWTGVLRLAGGDSAGAYQAFSAVASQLPGELAPIFAMAAAAEHQALGPGGALRPAEARWSEQRGATGDPAALEDAGQRYALVAATDPTYAGARFGLARVRWAVRDRAGADAALAGVPATSSAYLAAQAGRCQVLTAPLEGRPITAADLLAASEALDGLRADTATHLRLTRDVLQAGLGLLTSGAIRPDPQAALAGIPLDEHHLRQALERSCRALARAAATRAERVALIDEANSVRPRTLW